MINLRYTLQRHAIERSSEKALRSLTNASAISGNSESPSHADERQRFSCEVGLMPLESTDHATPSLVQMADTTTKLERTESKCSIQVEDKTEPIETVWKIDKTGTDQIDAVREVDHTGSDPIDAVQEIDNADSVAKAQDMKAVNNRTETEPDVTIPTRNKVPPFEESRIA